MGSVFMCFIRRVCFVYASGAAESCERCIFYCHLAVIELYNHVAVVVLLSGVCLRVCVCVCVCVCACARARVNLVCGRSPAYVGTDNDRERYTCV